ncbi:MAG: 50S ribosomal protein L25 [Nannocystis sp.]|jgi:large subunit ribosomal protein L25|nr:50S ribosomal protein L25 [Nannocystis sp.]
MTHESRKINVHVRTAAGKGAARTLRSAGKIPAVLYGRGGERLTLMVDRKELEKSIDPTRQWNTWFSVHVHEEGKGERVESCLVVDRQVHPIRRSLTHVDFMRVDPALEIEAVVPVEYTGRSVGVQAGGKLKTFRRSLKIAAVPANIPVKVTVDVTALDGNQTLRMEDLALDGFRLRERPSDPLAFVEAAKVKVVEAEEKKPAKKGKK